MVLKPLRRSDVPELLDAVEPPQGQLAGNLRDIVRANRYLGGTSSLVRSLAAVVQADLPDVRTPFSVLDVGTGAGDIPRAVAGWATAAGRTVRIWAVDVSGEIVRFARQMGPCPECLGFATADARKLPFRPGGVDYVVASLFLHHFDHEAAVRLLREFRDCARRAVIINDLRRARVSYATIFILTRLATINRMTRNDAPLSVLRGFLPHELNRLAAEAGFGNWRIVRFFPYRLALVGRPAPRS
ncbi:MAG: methyltransferase domain-containing protein [bacterium]